MLKKRLTLKLLIALGLLGIAYSPTFTEPACAAAPACDPKFMTSLRERAWREAQREVMTNETFIFKPDSVFALSCWGTTFNAAESSGSSFSNNGGKLNSAKSAVNSYMSTHFAHGTLGGANGSSQNRFDSCESMKTVWNDAKCRNLTLANFEAFAFNMGSDPRINNSRTCTTNPTSTWTSTETTMKTIGVIKPLVEGTSFDSAKLFLNITDPLNLLDPAQCAAGIETGVVIGSASANYNEIVCPNPGCVPKYEGSAMVCKPQ